MLLNDIFLLLYCGYFYFYNVYKFEYLRYNFFSSEFKKCNAILPYDKIIISMTMWGLLLALFSYLYNTKKITTLALIDIILCIILSVSTCLVCRIASGASTLDLA